MTRLHVCRHSIVNFLLTSPSATIAHKSIECTAEAKTGEYLAEQLIQVIEEVGPKNVVQVVTDSASNCRKAKRIICAKYPHITCSPCAPHILDLVLKDLAEQPHFKQVEERVRAVVRFVRDHGRVRAEFESKSNKHLKLPNNTRFKGKHIMLSVAISLRGSLQQTVFTPAFTDLLQSKDRNVVAAATDIKEAILDDKLWESAAGIVTLTAPISELLDYCNEQVCAACVYHACAALPDDYVHMLLHVRHVEFTATQMV